MPDEPGTGSPTLSWRVKESLRLRVGLPVQRRWNETIERHGPRSAEAMFGAAEWVSRLTHRAESNPLPAPIEIDGKLIDTVADLEAFTQLPRDVVEEILSRRRHLSFRAEWLATPERLREDHWFYLSSKSYLLNNAVHFPSPAFVEEFVLPFVPQGATVLDFGGGSGELVLRCVERGVRAAHLELNVLQREFVRFRVQRHGLGDRIDVLDPWDPPPRGAFQAVTAMDVIEHLPDPAPVVDDLLAALVPDGVLIEDSPFLISSSNPMHHEDFGLDAHLRARGFEVVHGEGGGTRVWRRAEIRPLPSSSP